MIHALYPPESDVDLSTELRRRGLYYRMKYDIFIHCLVYSRDVVNSNDAVLTVTWDMVGFSDVCLKRWQRLQRENLKQSIALKKCALDS